jgi:hypothetical protein
VPVKCSPISCSCAWIFFRLSLVFGMVTAGGSVTVRAGVAAARERVTAMGWRGCCGVVVEKKTDRIRGKRKRRPLKQVKQSK